MDAAGLFRLFQTVLVGPLAVSAFPPPHPEARYDERTELHCPITLPKTGLLCKDNGMDRDPIVDEIQDEWLGLNRDKKRWIIVEEADGYSMHVHTHDGVAPTSHHPNARAVAGRLLQLLHIGPVAPQTWPEEVCIGYIQTDAHDTPTTPEP